MSSKYGTVIFDMDGTLLKSTADDLTWMERSVERVLEDDFGKTDYAHISSEEMLKLAGIDGFKEFEKMSKKLDLNPMKAWTLISHSRALEKLRLLENKQLDFCEGFWELKKFLDRSQLKTGIVSNAPEDSVISVVEYFNLKRTFDFYTGISSKETYLKYRKPNPFYIEVALSELQREPVVFVGDSIVDVEAATKAGIDSILIGKKDSEGEIAPTYIVEDLVGVKEVIKK